MKKTASPKAGASKTGAAKAAAPMTAAQKTGSAKTAAPMTGAAKTASQKTGSAKTAAPKTGGAKTGGAKTAAPKTEASKVAAPKTAAPKADSSKTGSPNSKSPSQLIDARIAELDDWRGTTLGRLRALIKEADPEVVEEWKWMGTPVWEHDGIICTGETYKSVVKMTFAKGAALPDPSGLFNSSLEGNTRRAIDVREGEKINEKALKTLIRDAVVLNQSKGRR